MSNKALQFKHQQELITCFTLYLLQSPYNSIIVNISYSDTRFSNILYNFNLIEYIFN